MYSDFIYVLKKGYFSEACPGFYYYAEHWLLRRAGELGFRFEETHAQAIFRRAGFPNKKLVSVTEIISF